MFVDAVDGFGVVDGWIDVCTFLLLLKWWIDLARWMDRFQEYLRSTEGLVQEFLQLAKLVEPLGIL